MFNPIKLKENALTSIRLGVEDFQKSQMDDPARALSAVRNLFAGVLLLFKYRLTVGIDDPQQAHNLIFNPPEVLPGPDGNGGVVWEPKGKFKPTTIDLATIRKRFDAFKITVNWAVIDHIQKERNDLEHLHPASALGSIAEYVADLFPILRDFITNEMGESPADLLGETWAVMLGHHVFFDATLAECKAAWITAAVPDRMESILSDVRCPNCGSPLLRPADDTNDAGATVDEPGHTLLCMACNHHDATVPLMEEVLLESMGGYSAYDDDFCPVETCPNCDHETFVVQEAECFWCNETLEYSTCAVCGEGLSLEDQANHGLCGYHNHVMERERGR
ncbi:MAG: zinc ribbon domain-containing protein [Pseudomonadota bacterium]